MIRQVFVNERVTVTTDTGTITRTLDQLAFGTHPDFTNANDSTEVTNALAAGSQTIRIVMDELLNGSTVEQLSCADGSWSDIPDGTTPDDIAKCAGQNLTNCKGDHAVCLMPDGTPIGILDVNPPDDGDGAADAFRLIPDTVVVECDGTPMPIDVEKSFYQPSGNQLIPAGVLGIHGLGPALIIQPRIDNEVQGTWNLKGFKTSSTCAIKFADKVTDKDGIKVCTPPGGDITRSDACTPGDTSLISFKVEPMRILGSDPTDGMPNVRLTNDGSDALSIFQFSVELDIDSAAGLSITEGGATVDTGRYTVEFNDTDRTTLVVRLTGGYMPLTDYVVTIPGGTGGVTDAHGGPLPADVTISFSTRDATPVPDAGAPDAQTPDAGVADAGQPDA